ncbi:NlpC/P60 family protein [Stackebrandtia albiflava]|uniref:NlpC/P60 family protein n=1 Tax=Stackebrandtia albiflava TaxID=406432 RepID=A0A562V1W6_9ACTN|nr:NlpC/P60 family protein [Stackebrandtia albiflava]TWJ11896.1 NlpC/P60 family protein [Stackebrandtia albiflava]
MTRSPRFDAFARRLLITSAAVCAVAAPGVAVAEPDIQTLEHRLADVTGELDVIVEDYNRLDQELTDVTARYTELADAIIPLRDRADAAGARIGDIAEALYRGGDTATVTSLLSGSPESLADRLTVLDYLAHDRRRELDALVDAETELESRRLLLTDLTERRGELEDLKTDKEREISEAVTELGRARAQAVGAGFRFGPDLVPPPVPGGDAGAAGVAVRFVHGALGTPYQWGGSGPGGYDCSGLTSAAWSSAGVSLPHSSQGQYHAVARIDRSRLQPGDLVFYYGDLRHVGMYVGDGKIIHAPTAGQPVQVAPIDQMPVQGYGRPG